MGEEGGRRRREVEGVEDEEKVDDEKVEKDECEELRLVCCPNHAAHHYSRDNYNCKLKIQFRETFYCNGLIFIYRSQGQKPVRHDTPFRDRNLSGKTRPPHSGTETSRARHPDTPEGMPTSRTRYSLDIVPRQTSNTSIQEPQPYIKHIITSTTL